MAWRVARLERALSLKSWWGVVISIREGVGPKATRQRRPHYSLKAASSGTRGGALRTAWPERDAVAPKAGEKARRPHYSPKAASSGTQGREPKAGDQGARRAAVASLCLAGRGTRHAWKDR